MLSLILASHWPMMPSITGEASIGLCCWNASQAAPNRSSTMPPMGELALSMTLGFKVICNRSKTRESTTQRLKRFIASRQSSHFITPLICASQTPERQEQKNPERK